MGAKRIHITEAIKFIRSKGGLKSMDDLQVARLISDSIRNGLFRYTTKDGEIDGLAIVRWNDPNSIHIAYIAGHIHPFLSDLKRLYPEVSEITGIRNNKPVQYQINNFKV